MFRERLHVTPVAALLMTPGLSGLGKNRGWRKPCVSVWVGQDNCSRVVMMSYYPAHTTATQSQPGYPAPSPGSGPMAEVLCFVRSSVDKKPTASFRLLGAGWCWRLGRIVNSLNEYSISPRHLHKSHITNSKQFCLTVALKLHYECPSWSVPRSFVTLT